jgi:hypothetical protein
MQMMTQFMANNNQNNNNLPNQDHLAWFLRLNPEPTVADDWLCTIDKLDTVQPQGAERVLFDAH